MKKEITQLAIIGPTASGKSDLAINIALKIDAYILSIDSLSIYREIDIVSAKPSKEELSQVKHFGINVLNPDEYFSVDIFINLYKNLLEQCKKESKNLVIVGGTSFYLKSLLQGLSQLPKITKEISHNVAKELSNLASCYNLLSDIDPQYMKNIDKKDSYRIEKALLIYRASQLLPTQWFELHPPKAIIKDLNIFNIDVSRDTLRQRITSRTNKMIDLGLINEVCYLEKKYARLAHSMGSIGIVEVLEYLDGKVTKEIMLENISTHTAQLAKRQQTFNRTQFNNITSAPLHELEKIILQKL
ncbi:MAG: tRNA dimethylallyltransferase [Sulfurimonas sp.]|jgi:tRNA dimethylallyltransferase|uniref:tRNA (adenosine(37)-N6)-dimethylallyltransferase MiaA n=1 Tax=Sulfurimonas sp. TaxID=2022749 RepID=UPI0039E611D8